jgi:hypothetical protein
VVERHLVGIRGLVQLQELVDTVELLQGRRAAPEKRGERDRSRERLELRERECGEREGLIAGQVERAAAILERDHVDHDQDARHEAGIERRVREVERAAERRAAVPVALIDQNKRKDRPESQGERRQRPGDAPRQGEVAPEQDQEQAQADGRDDPVAVAAAGRILVVLQPDRLPDRRAPQHPEKNEERREPEDPDPNLAQ